MSGIMIGSTRPTFGTAVATPSSTAQPATPQSSVPMSALDANIAQLSKQFGSFASGTATPSSDAFAPANPTASPLTFGTEKSGGGGMLAAAQPQLQPQAPAAQPMPQADTTLATLLAQPQHQGAAGLENAFLSQHGGGGAASGTIGTFSDFLKSAG